MFSKKGTVNKSNSNKSILHGFDKKAASILKGIFKTATMISDFDLKLSFYGKKIKASADTLNSMFTEIASSSEEISTSTTQIVNTNSELNHIISEISHDAEILQQNSKESDEILSTIKTENKEMVTYSKDMDQSISDLLIVIQKINNAVKDINKISDQTKILSLNASIEAARAGMAGKGFAVVADEIRSLSETTKELTSNIDSLLLEMNDASNRSKMSIEKTSESIDRVSNSIENVSDVMEENSNAIGNITKRITEVADMSNEINSSLQESSSALDSVNNDIQNLVGAAKGLQDISDSVNSISTLISDIDVTVQGLASISGEMVNKNHCGFSNDDFIEAVENAIKAHKNWVVTVKTMINDRTLIPIQTDEHKCGFGHFYYSVQPNSQKLTGLWKEVEHYHHTLHKSGESIIHCIQRKDFKQAASLATEAEKLSQVIVGKFEEMVKITKEMTLTGESVF
ncbi:MAG: hypothetical protein GX299_00030 [Epulopiscium sp.]|nr:hypothetical protein [Candidatus Epulonipiscium sp.]